MLRRTILLSTLCAVATSCRAGREPGLRAFSYRAQDATTLPFRIWGARNNGAVLLCVHGLGGSPTDYRQLGEQMAKAGHTTYSVGVRGQSVRSDTPGDIESGGIWMQDLMDYHRLVKAREPNRKIVWLGESLGSMIVTLAATDPSLRLEEKPDGLLLTSPAVGLRYPPSDLTLGVLRVVGALMPGLRVTLGGMAGRDIQAVSWREGGGQLAQRNFTLRTFRAMDGMMNRMPGAIAKWHRPLRVFFTPNDSLSSSSQVCAFTSLCPCQDKKAYFFSKSYHLIFHDKQQSSAFRLVREFLEEVTKN